MKYNFDSNIKKTVKKLPVFRHKDCAWKAISNQLDFEDKISIKTKVLPQFKHKKGLWDEIEKKCDENVKNFSPRKIRKIVFYSSSIAASVLLFVALYTHISGKYEMTYTEEIILHEPVIKQNNTVSDNPAAVIETLCSQAAYICNSPDFIDKKKRLLEIEDEIKKINKVIETYGESDALVRVLIKMENQKAGLIKTLFKNATS